VVATLKAADCQWQGAMRFRKRCVIDQPCEKGWGALDFANCPAGVMPVSLKLDLSGSAKTIGEVCDYIRQAYAVEPVSEKLGYDVKVYIPAPADTASGYFAWDFEHFDPTVKVTGVRFAEPSDIATVIILR